MLGCSVAQRFLVSVYRPQTENQCHAVTKAIRLVGGDKRALICIKTALCPSYGINSAVLWSAQIEHVRERRRTPDALDAAPLIPCKYNRALTLYEAFALSSHPTLL